MFQETLNGIVTTVYLWIAFAVLMLMCAFGAHRGRFKGKRTCKRALRRIARKIPGGELVDNKHELYARWPLDFGQSDEPRGWLTLRCGKPDGAWGLELFIEGEGFQQPGEQYMHGWVWRSAPLLLHYPPHVWQMKGMYEMVEGVRWYILMMLSPRVQQQFTTPRDLWYDARFNCHLEITSHKPSRL